MITPSILVVAERAGEPQMVLRKAAVLARHLGAQLELFACDLEHAGAVAQRHCSAAARGVVEACLADSARYLAALRGTVAARDLTLRTCAACAPSLYEALLCRSAALQPMLVVKACTEPLWRYPGVVLRPDDLRLLREPPAPLLLTRGRTWQPLPIIGAWAADAREAASLVPLAKEFAARCHGRFERLLPGAAPSSGRVLAERVAEQRIDVLALPAAPGRTAEAADESPLPEELVGVLACDVLVVPRGSPPPEALADTVALRVDPA